MKTNKSAKPSILSTGIVRQVAALALSGLALIGVQACGGNAEKPAAGEHDHASPGKGHDHGHDHDHDHADHKEGHGHEHKPPHGGTLVAFGEEAAHAEFVLDAEGKLTAYLLDGEAEHAVRAKQSEIEIVIRNREGEPAMNTTAKMAAIANTLTGETVGETSEFAATVPDLKGRARFEAVITTITLKGQTFEKVSFRFPEGNE